MAHRASFLRSAFVALSVSFSACGYEPGHDYAVTVTWLINGLAPTRDQCVANDVDRVRFTLHTPSTDYVIDTPCEEALAFDDGDERGGFVTTTDFDYGVEYVYKLEMLDSGGKLIPGLTDSTSFRAYYGEYTPYELRSLELYQPRGELAALSGSWTVGRDIEDGCAALGIDNVVLEVASRTDPEFTEPEEVLYAPCTEGVAVSDGPILAEGDYFLRYVAYRGSAPVAASDATPVLVDRSGEVFVPAVAF